MISVESPYIIELCKKEMVNKNITDHEYIVMFGPYCHNDARVFAHNLKESGGTCRVCTFSATDNLDELFYYAFVAVQSSEDINLAKLTYKYNFSKDFYKDQYDNVLFFKHWDIPF